MIKSSKIQEWINEIEERPMIAPFIVRRLSDRLLELDQLNEELRSENLLLSTGQKTAELERRIAELEYQIELLKRQVHEDPASTYSDTANLLIYDTEGRILTHQFSPRTILSAGVQLSLQGTKAHRDDVHLLVAVPQDELVMLMHTGRIATMKAKEIVHPASDPLTWEKAFKLDLRSGEKLASVAAITQAPFCEHFIQVTRKGYARSFPQDLFQTFLSRRNLGKGVKSDADQLLCLLLGSAEDILVLVSRGGYISALPVSRLTVGLEEIMRLDMQDYLVAAFIIHPEQLLVIAAEDGELLVQKNPWGDPADANGIKRRVLARSKAGSLHLMGAGAAGSGSTAFLLSSSGEINVQRITESTPAKPSAPATRLEGGSQIAFTLFEQVEPQ